MICEQCFDRLIFVHGHYQCEHCHWVGLTCCDGETVAASVTLEE